MGFAAKAFVPEGLNDVAWYEVPGKRAHRVRPVGYGMIGSLRGPFIVSSIVANASHRRIQSHIKIGRALCGYPAALGAMPEPFSHKQFTCKLIVGAASSNFLSPLPTEIPCPKQPTFLPTSAGQKIGILLPWNNLLHTRY